MTAVAAGLGWPETEDDVNVRGLGWPYDGGDVSRETAPSAAPPEAGTDVSRETAATAEPLPLPAHCRVIAVANQKGGVGKTTSAVNLAAALGEAGARVLLVDLDPQGNASTAFGIDRHADMPSMYDVLLGGRAVSAVAKPVGFVDGVTCAPATVDLAGAEIELVPMVARESRLRRALEPVREDFDYIFIDCPPSLGLLTVNALVAADEVLVPIQCEYYALEGVRQLLENIELVRTHLNPGLRVSTVVLTMYDSRTRLAEQVAADVRAHFGPLVLQTAIPRSVRVSEAPSFGQPVMTYDPTSRGAQAYYDAAWEMAEQGEQR